MIQRHEERRKRALTDDDIKEVVLQLKAELQADLYRGVGKTIVNTILGALGMVALAVTAYFAMRGYGYYANK